jgi:hypothetical protein
MKRAVRRGVVTVGVVLAVGAAGSSAAFATDVNVPVPVPGNPCTIHVHQDVNLANTPPANVNESTDCTA